MSECGAYVCLWYGKSVMKKHRGNQVKWHYTRIHSLKPTYLLASIQKYVSKAFLVNCSIGACRRLSARGVNQRKWSNNSHTLSYLTEGLETNKTAKGGWKAQNLNRRCQQMQRNCWNYGAKRERKCKEEKELLHIRICTHTHTSITDVKGFNLQVFEIMQTTADNVSLPSFR